MTKEDLINAGYTPQNCKIGTLYFKGGFFCRLDKDEAVYFSISDDMNPLGRAKTLDDINELEKKFYKEEIEALEATLSFKKKLFAERFGNE